MSDVLSATGPIFIIVALGYVLTRLRVFRREDIGTMSRFVVKVALPVLIFLNILGRSASEILQPVYLLTYAGAAFVMLIVAHVYCLVRGRSAFRAAVLSMAMSGSNSGFIGLPMFLMLIPDWAGVAVAMAMLVDNMVLLPVALFLLSRATGTGGHRTRLLSAAKGVVSQPLMIAILLALLGNAVGFTLPEVLERSATLLAQVSTGLALFSVGGMLVGLRLKGAGADVGLAVVGKLVLMPTVGLGLVLGLQAVGLPSLPIELQMAAVVTCALPTFAILPAIVDQYGDTDVATAAMMLSTVLSFLTMTAWLQILSATG